MAAPEESPSASVQALRSAHDPTTILVVMTGRVDRTDARRLAERVRELLESQPGKTLICDLAGITRSDAAVVDLVYRPAVTPLLAAAAELGLTRQNGLPMLVWQGAESFSRWTARPAPVEVMRAAAESALRESTPGRGQH